MGAGFQKIERLMLRTFTVSCIFQKGSDYRQVLPATPGTTSVDEN